MIFASYNAFVQYILSLSLFPENLVIVSLLPRVGSDILSTFGTVPPALELDISEVENV